ncbi:DNA polymerase III subunit delta [Candidatus Parcubacteria bacterium]|nr:DNA polymerase III subunit delta [Candidatus Parcubacteria bacterium]
MVIILSGQDTFRSRAKLRQIIAQYRAKNPDGLGLVRFSGEELTETDVVGALAGTSLFSTKRLVIVERPENASDEAQKRMADAAGRSDAVTVFWCDRSLDNGSPLAELAAKRGAQHEEFKPLRGLELNRWIIRYVASCAATIERGAVAALVAAAGSDTWRLANEVEKLAAHADGRSIGARDVAALVTMPVNPQAFAFADALASRDRAAALTLLHEHLEAGDSPQALLGMIGYALRTLFLVSIAAGDLSARPRPAALLAKTLELHPFVVTKALRQSRSFTQEDLQRATQLLADADWYMKTGRLEPELALERFVMAVTLNG